MIYMMMAYIYDGGIYMVAYIFDGIYMMDIYVPYVCAIYMYQPICEIYMTHIWHRYMAHIY